MELTVFTHNIVWLRRYYGLSKTRMAKMMGIGVRSLNQIEQGTIPPRLTVEVLFAIQRQFGISPSLLLQKPFEDGEQLCAKEHFSA